MPVYHEYTSALGGNIFLPLNASLFRNFLRFRNSLDTSSSFRKGSQLSSRVFISSARSSLCSSVREATQASLSNLDAALELPVLVDLPDAGFGAPKKAVMLLFSSSQYKMLTAMWVDSARCYPFDFGFLASESSALPAFRLRDMVDNVKAPVR